MSCAAMVVMTGRGADMSSSLHPVVVNHHLMVCRHRVVRVLMLVHRHRFIRAQHAGCNCALEGKQNR